MAALTVPPTNPDPTQRYLIGSGAVGAWAGRDGQLARWNITLGYWEFYYGGMWSADPSAETSSPSNPDYPPIEQPWPMPTASATVLGGVKVGAGLHITSDGTISSGMNADELDAIAEANAPSAANPFATINDIGGSPLQIVCGEDVKRGQPLAVSPQDNRVYLADITTMYWANVIGLAADDTSAGFAVHVLRDMVTLNDWSAVTGSAALAYGVPYFLSGRGVMSQSRPTSVGQFLVRIGEAVSPNKFIPLFQPPIQL